MVVHQSLLRKRNKLSLTQDDEEPCASNNAVCQSNACREAAERVTAALKWSADPCHDFYQFACGGWGRHQALTALQERVDNNLRHLLSDATSGNFKKLGDFYQSCVGAESNSLLSPMFDLLDELGGYLPPTSQGFVDVSLLLGKLLRVNGAPMFDVYIDRDLQNGTRHVIFVDLPRRFGHTSRLFHRPYNVDELPTFLNRQKRYTDESRAYLYLKDSSEERRLLTMEGLIHKFLPATMAKDQKVKESHSTLLFASMLSKLYPRAKEIAHRLQHDDSYEYLNLTQLQKTYSFVQWKPLFEHVFSTSISSSDTIYVMAPIYMQNLGHLLTHFQTRVVHNSLLLIYATDILHELVNSTTSNRSLYCVRVAASVYSQAVSAMYVTQYSPQYIQQLGERVREMFNKLKATLEKRLKSVSWMDDETRVKALKKLAALKVEFATWPQLSNQTFLESLLQDVEVSREDFFGNVINRYRQMRTFSVDFHKQPSSDKKWAFPFIVNAFYEVTLNTIVIPLSLVTQPYFRSDMPHYIQYSTVGLIVSHEMVHAFDALGAGWGGGGEQHQWMTAAARLRLEARLQCIAKQYSTNFRRQVSFRGVPIEIQFDWNITRNENMADISGLQMAYETWLQLQDKHRDPSLSSLNLKPTQLFFLHAAQVYCIDISPEDYIVLVEKDFHTPAPERVNGIMMNSQGFSNAFKCLIGTKMNPAKKCSTY
ncbi:hypothetical protein LSTR_LSTR003912 [Laodelphax striatellus]|uniref:Peptidase M13 N-terminal domain-containing protein n=1 Tax=Laodelphax striatellus TaxID=195883 RepID=A0A482X912_LAOST|nr:hypothetical protein LSTR_LSTR003912 [Laodelphax striatellus]